jgi:hypothetical protein
MNTNELQAYDPTQFYDTCFFYSNIHGYNITVAYRRSIDRAHVVYGAAFCRPSDRFTKSLGRNIAVGRMETRPYFLDIFSDMCRFDMHDEIIESIANLTYAPENLSASLVTQNVA